MRTEKELDALKKEADSKFDNGKIDAVEYLFTCYMLGAELSEWRNRK